METPSTVETFHAMRDVRRACGAVRVFVTLDFGTKRVYVSVRDAEAFQQSLDRSIALLERARALDPELHAAQLHLALAYRKAGRGDDAAALLRDLLSRVDEKSPMGVEASGALRSLGG